MFKKLSLVWNLFRQGEAVANPAAWHDKNAQAQRITALILLIVCALKTFNVKVFGHAIDIDQQLAFEIGVAIAGIGAWITNQVTSEHAGFLPAKPPVSEPAIAERPVPDEPAPEAVQAAGDTAAGVQPDGPPADGIPANLSSIFEQRG